MLWAHGDGPGRLVARLIAGAHVGHVLHGPYVDEGTDFTGRLDLTGLTPGRAYDASLWFENDDGTRGEVGHLGFRTAAMSRRPASFAWVGAGGGAGIAAAVHRMNPDVLVDLGPVVETGSATTVEEFRALHRRLSDDVDLRALRADVPVVAVWDDHETHRGWRPGAVLDGPTYDEPRVDVLAARARRAWQEYRPVRTEDLRHRGDDGFAGDRIYRRVARGPLLDLFCLDLRVAAGLPLLGAEQTDWLVRELNRSTALWKVLAADTDPRLVADDEELGRLRRALRDHQTTGVLWVHPDPAGVGLLAEQELEAVVPGAAFGHATVDGSGRLTVRLLDPAGEAGRLTLDAGEEQGRGP